LSSSSPSAPPITPKASGATSSLPVAGKSPSRAARRANSGSGASCWVAPASPSRSSRTAQSSRAADNRPPARPVNRRPSGRP
jgi:hypothetical protein